MFRQGWRTDLAYFFVSALLVQVTTLLTMKPAMMLFDWAASRGRAARRVARSRSSCSSSRSCV